MYKKYKHGYDSDTKVGDEFGSVGGFPLGSIITCGPNIFMMSKYNWEMIRNSDNGPNFYVVQYLPEKPLEVGQTLSRLQLQDLPAGTIFTYQYFDFGQIHYVLAAAEGGAFYEYGGSAVSRRNWASRVEYILQYLPETSN